jgi:hypothetical protein
MIAMGFIKTWDAMAGMRVLLGILEVSGPLHSHEETTAKIFRPASFPVVYIY